MDFTDEQKVCAFDEIAKHFYNGNFGTMQKSEVDLLMFSIYIEHILDKSEDDINSYSDYELAKQLGITQSTVSNLKVKKQLKYPYEKFDWRKSFKRVCKNARLESGKMKINLRDKNLYYELKNQIDMSGGYVEGSLTPNLLIITPEEFFDLTKTIMTPKEIDGLEEIIKEKNREEKDFCEKFEKASTGEILKAKFGAGMVSMVLEAIKIVSPGIVGAGIEVLKAGYEAIKE